MIKKALRFLLLFLIVFTLGGCITIRTKEQKENQEIKEQTKEVTEKAEDQTKETEDKKTDNSTASYTESNQAGEKNQAYREYGVGEEVELNDLSLKIYKVGNFNNYDSFWGPNSGRKYYFVNITMQNKGSGEIKYMRSDFILQDKESHPYNEAFLGSYEGLLDTSGTLLAGEMVNGDVVYDVPQNYNEFILIYRSYAGISLNKFLVFEIK